MNLFTIISSFILISFLVFLLIECLISIHCTVFLSFLLSFSNFQLYINETEYFKNNVRVLKFVMDNELALLRKKVNRGTWEMTPHTVNAYYSPVKNEMGRVKNNFLFFRNYLQH